MERLNKTIAIISFILFILIGLVIGLIVSLVKDSETAKAKEETKVAEAIFDECTDEYENSQNQLVKTNSEKEKISPNAKLILKKYYNRCGDIISEYLTIPEKLVNKTKEDLQNEYKDWTIKEFSAAQIVLYKEFSGECGQHYILRDGDGKIVINKISENGEEVLYEQTQIAISYLPENDQNAIKEGIKVQGKEKLNELIESFE